MNEKLDVNYASATALCNLIPFWPQCMISWLPIEKDEEDDDVDDNEDRKDDPAIPAEDDDCRSDHNAWLPDCQSRQTNYSLSATMQCLPSSISGIWIICTLHLMPIHSKKDRYRWWDNLTPRTIWHLGQFNTVYARRTIWHLGQFDTVTQHIPTMTDSHHGGFLSVMNMVGICQVTNSHHKWWWRNLFGTIPTKMATY